MDEKWLDIKDYPNYQVSNFGNVRNKKTGKIKSKNSGRKYPAVWLINEHGESIQSIHKLVAEAFLEKNGDNLVVNHKDGNKNNNNLDNLEWCTQQENNIHAINNYLNHPGYYQKRYIRVKETGEIFFGLKDAENKTGCDFRNIYRSLNHGYSVNGLHFEYIHEKTNGLYLMDYQLEAIEKIKSGCVLCGTVGSGKSITAIAYFYLKICEGKIKMNGSGCFEKMKNPRDLYIITTAKKRDSFEWEKECSKFVLSRKRNDSVSGIQVTVDSWNNIKKYEDVYGAFFIFDEQRLIGGGAWVKAFLKIARKNQWILLSATPADTYSDYIPIFIANGFFKNKSEFNNLHCVFSPYSKFPKIERYVGTKKLDQLIEQVLVKMEDQRTTVRHNEYIEVEYDRNLYRIVMKNRWDPYEDCPIEETGKLLYLIRKVVNSDLSRIDALDKIVKDKQCCIVFYNFTYELNMLREYAEASKIKYKEWNGEKHQDLPKGERWLYFVQYAAGSEGWNCTATDTIVLFSQTYSYRTLEQASGRIDRMNTPFQDLYYYHFRSNAPIDIAIWRKLKDKKNFNERSFIRRNCL